MQLDILEYIHEHEYVHADIKASNLMLSYSDTNQVGVMVMTAKLATITTDRYDGVASFPF